MIKARLAASLASAIVFSCTSGVSAAPTERVLYAFTGSPNDGSFPVAGLLAYQGGYVGVTMIGGNPACTLYGGCGVVYELKAAGRRYAERILHYFSNTPDGANPYGGLIADAAGALYGTTQNGGLYNSGTVFKLTPRKRGGGFDERILYNFTGGKGDGLYPASSLVMDEHGALYGTTFEGGTDNYGTLFALTPTSSGYSERLVYSFQLDIYGAAPYAVPIEAAGGAFYGTTTTGGNATCKCGSVYAIQITPHPVISLLHDFTESPDGASPYGPLVAARDGTLFGTTLYGGNDVTCNFSCGTFFKLAPGPSGYIESVVHKFGGVHDGDGSLPFGGLTLDKRGVLAGATAAGGADATCAEESEPGCGIVFEFAPSGSGYRERILHNFTGPPDGAMPYDTLIEPKPGTYVGTTGWGGRHIKCSQPQTLGCGTVFEVSD